MIMAPVPLATTRRTARYLAAAASTAVLAAAGLAATAHAGPAPQPAALVDPAVYAELADGGTTEFLVYLTDTADLSPAATLTDRDQRLAYGYEQLTSVAETSQADLRAMLDARGVPYTPYWITNALLVTGDATLLAELTRRPDVARIEPDREWELPDPTSSPALSPTMVEWNIAMIRAPQVWNELGVTGEGITVATIETGVEYDHPALVNQYRGNLGNGTFDHNYHWFDPAGACPAPAPCDLHGHGTHLAGTMVGDDGVDNQIGVAPGAQWIATNACGYGSCSSSALLAAAQWLIAPTDLTGDNPRLDLTPHVVVSGSAWPQGPWFEQVIQAWVAVGIFPVFAAGNYGPGCGTVTWPASSPWVYAVGAHNAQGVIAPSSSRGSFLGDIKPDVAAPGVMIRSAVPGGGYASLGGTATAAAHMAGTVALIWSASPATVGAIPLTHQLLDQGAVDVSDLSCGGTPGNNNVYGEGRLDAYASVAAAP